MSDLSLPWFVVEESIEISSPCTLRIVSVKILGPSLIPYWCWALALHGCLILALLLVEVTLCAKGLHPLIIYRNDCCLQPHGPCSLPISSTVLAIILYTLMCALCSLCLLFPYNCHFDEHQCISQCQDTFTRWNYVNSCLFFLILGLIYLTHRDNFLSTSHA